jgi:hypothetical protein
VCWQSIVLVSPLREIIMAKRLTRRLTDVIEEVVLHLKAHHSVTQKDIDAWRLRAQRSSYKFPVTSMIEISTLWIDYEIQRDVIYKHILNIMKKWDPRICSPGSACRTAPGAKTFLYDAQHRTIAAGILGFTELPCAVVETPDPNFASYAFELLNDTGIARLNQSDLHRNAIVRFKNGSRERKSVNARTVQDQFDAHNVDLEDKAVRKSPTLRGDSDYYFSHFKYAYKAIEQDDTGKVLSQILDAIKSVFPLQEEIDQGVFIGLAELRRLAGTSPNVKLPADWMKILLLSLKPEFSASSTLHSKAKSQWTFYKGDGATWTAPVGMSNFMRECHIVAGGTLNLPYHGEGARMGIDSGILAPGLFPEAQLAD